MGTWFSILAILAKENLINCHVTTLKLNSVVNSFTIEDLRRGLWGAFWSLMP